MHQHASTTTAPVNSHFIPTNSNQNELRCTRLPSSTSATSSISSSTQPPLPNHHHPQHPALPLPRYAWERSRPCPSGPQQRKAAVTSSGQPPPGCVELPGGFGRLRSSECWSGEKVVLFRCTKKVKEASPVFSGSGFLFRCVAFVGPEEVRCSHRQNGGK